MANNSTNLTGLWSKGNRGTLWGVNLKPGDVSKMIETLRQFETTGCDLSLWANEVEAGSKKPAMSLKAGPPWVKDGGGTGGGGGYQDRGPATGGNAGGDESLPF